MRVPRSAILPRFAGWFRRSSLHSARLPRACAANFAQMPMPVRLHYAPKPRHSRPRSIVLVCLVAAVVGGCATSSEWVKVRDTPRNPLAGTLNLLSRGGPKPTERTMQLLRRYDLEGELHGDRAALLAR